MGFFRSGMAIFSMFFGGGNLIFPLWMGSTTSSTTVSILGFILSGVLLPFYGIFPIWNGHLFDVFRRWEFNFSSLDGKHNLLNNSLYPWIHPVGGLTAFLWDFSDLEWPSFRCFSAVGI